MEATHMLGAPATTPLHVLLAAEVRRMLGLRHLLTLAAMIGMCILLAIWLPMFPESVLRFFQRVFALPGWSEIVFANALTGLFFFIYWLGVFDALAIYVLPYEERTLDLFLAKPVSQRTYMLARLVPIMVVMMLIGAAAALVCWMAMRAAGLAYAPSAFFGACAAALAWTVLLVTVVNLLVLSVHDSFSAAVVGFVPMFLAILPSMIFMYRPDLLEPAPALKDVLVFPMSLVWYPAIAARYGALIAAALLAVACLCASIAGTVMARRDLA